MRLEKANDELAGFLPTQILIPISTQHFSHKWQISVPFQIQHKASGSISEDENLRLTTVNVNFFRTVVAAIGRKHKAHRGQVVGEPSKGKNKNKGSWRTSLSRRFAASDSDFFFGGMGNEESTPVDESTPPSTLSGRTLEAVAEYIKSGKVQKVVVMTGAGISTSAGIPDFRSPETGLYANLARLNLPYAEAVFDISYFRQNPEPFYTLAHEIYPGRYRPTITHSFINLLNQKGMLLKCFTQNIDCLEREAGVPDDKMVEAHGSFARQSCIECKQPYPEDDIKKHIDDKTIPHCYECKGLVKPEIVFFGEALPAAFFENRGLPYEADLAIVMGTSLTVQPFASLPSMAREETPRILINKERVGSLGTRADDVMILGDCDEGVMKLAEACGWLDELKAMWKQTEGKFGGGGGKPDDAPAKPVKQKTKDEELEDEIKKLTKDVDDTLDLSRWHTDKVKSERLPGEKAVSKGAAHEQKEGNLSHVFVGAENPLGPTAPKTGAGDDAEKDANGDGSKL